MTEKLPLVSGRDLVDALGRLGWAVARRRGSHVVLVREGHIATLSVPDHAQVARGTLRSLLRSAGLTPGELLRALRRGKTS